MWLRGRGGVADGFLADAADLAQWAAVYRATRSERSAIGYSLGACAAVTHVRQNRIGHPPASLNCSVAITGEAPPWLSRSSSLGFGKIRNPQYRISVADARTRRDGRAIEVIGRYHPKEEPSLIEIDSERAQYWLGVGAQPTEPVLRC